MLQIRDLTYRIGGRLLFEGANLALPSGHKVGLVGRNGSGKTTLFRLIAGEIQPEAGTIAVPARHRVGRVAQEAPGGPQSLLETVLATDEERAALTQEAERADDPARIAEIHTRLADIEAHTAPARAATILAGLGFDEAAQQRPCQEFSGGWRMRVALAGALFARPDLLLLDEPTNHLDLESALWLESYLARWSGSLIIISHERGFLNEVAEEIVHLHGRALTRYAGNYDRFERTRRERLEREAKTRKRQEAERQRIQAFIDRFRAKATKARQAQSRIKQLARMEPISAVIEERTPALDFPAPGPLAPPLIALDGAAAGYVPDKPVLRGLRLRIDMDDRIALLGANGSGKSTLIKLLAGRLEPAAGRLHKPGKLRVGYFAQHQAAELEADGTPLSHIARLMPNAPEARQRAQIGRFGFAQEHADVRVASLSGGEKARLLLALMSRDAPHLMLLDEPTNHLDVDARESLVQALNAYEGAVVLVSHDAHLIELVCDRLWLVGDGGCAPFDGDLSDYRRQLLEARRLDRRARNGDSTPGPDRRTQRRAKADMRARTAPLRRAAREAEKQMAKLGQKKAALEAKLASPGLYRDGGESVSALQIRLAETAQALEQAEEAWLSAQSAIEEAEMSTSDCG